MSMRSLIEKLEKRPKTVDAFREDQKTEFVVAVRALFDQIESWIPKDMKVLDVTRSELSLEEPDFGAYDVPVLEIRDRGTTVRLEPVGARVVGVVRSGGHRLIGLRGRVNLICGPTNIPLVRDQKKEWKIVPMRGEPRALDEDNFAEILGAMLLDE